MTVEPFEWHSWQRITPPEPADASCQWWTVIVPPVAVEGANVWMGWPGYTWSVTLGPPPDPNPDVDDSIQVIVWYLDAEGTLIASSGDSVAKPTGVHELTGFLAWSDADTDIVEIVGVQVASAFRASGFPVGRNFNLRDAGQVANLGGVTWPEAATFYYGEKIATDDGSTQDEPAGGTVIEPYDDWVKVDDLSAAVVSWSINYGRGDSNAKAGPVQVTVILADERIAGPVPVVGERFRLTLPADMIERIGLEPDAGVRFTGDVTGVDLDGRHPDGSNVSHLTHSVTGVGRLGRASRKPLAARWPVELDGPRVARTLREADLVAGDIDAGVFELGRPTGANVGPLLDGVVDSAGGVVVEQLTGVVDYHDAQHRRTAVPLLTLEASELLNEVRWAQHVGDVINILRVVYAGGEVTVVDHRSVRKNGPFPGQLTTNLTTKSDAYSLGSLIVARRRTPAWQLPALVVDVRRCFTEDDPRLAQLLALRHGDRITVTGFPASSPYDDTVDVFVEGHREEASRAAWRLALAVSDPTLSGASIRWVDVHPALRWIDVDPDLTWRDVALLDDPEQLGSPGFDGGAPDTATWIRTIDGGAPDTTAWTTTIDGGTP